MDPVSSVRVEVDDSTDASAEIPSAPDSSGRTAGRWAALAGGVVLVIGLIVGLAALSPDDGEAADGALRQATTTTMPETTATSPPSSVDTFATQEFESVPNQFDPQINGIVRADVGFLGLGFFDGAGGLPPLFASADGAVWTPIDAELVGLDPGDQDGFWQYSNLERVEDGFALLRSRPGRFAASAAQLGTITERLVSPGGLTWTRDDSFRPLETSGSRLTAEFHLPEAFGTVSVVENDLPALGELLNQVLVDGALEFEDNEACRLEPLGTFLTDIRAIRTIPCRGVSSAGVILSAEDLVDPDSFESVLTCADVLVALGEEDISTAVQRSGEVAPVSVDSPGAFRHKVTPDGSIVSISWGDRVLVNIEACDSFPGVLPDPAPPAIEILLPDDSFRRIPLPAGAPDAFTASLLPSVTATDTGLLVMLERSLWSLDFNGDVWTLLQDFPPFGVAFTDLRLIDSERAFAVSPSFIGLLDLETGEVSLGEAAPRDFPLIYYLDDEVAVVTDIVTPGRVAMVDLTEGNPAFDSRLPGPQ